MTRRSAHTNPRILIAGGGTGGHVYPAIAIADAVRSIEPDADIVFAGTKDRLEWTAVPKAGYPINAITVSGFQRSLSPRNLTFPFKLAKGLVESWTLVGSFKPDVVVGTGGYVSGPVLWSAGVRGRPTLIQEQNAFAGVTNRMLAKRAVRIHVAFDEAIRYFPEEKCVVSGNPVRSNLNGAHRTEALDHFGIPHDASVLFVFGGSLGSVILNDALERQFESILEPDNTFVIWQTGRRHYNKLATRVEHSRLRLLPYIDRMDAAYAAADLVVARAGAITCSELMVTGRPAILVPAKAVAEDHQTRNAEALSSKGAATLLSEDRLEQLGETVSALLGDRAGRDAMSRALRELAKPDAAAQIARDVLKLAEEGT